MRWFRAGESSCLELALLQLPIWQFRRFWQCSDPLLALCVARSISASFTSISRVILLLFDYLDRPKLFSFNPGSPRASNFRTYRPPPLGFTQFHPMSPNLTQD